MMSVLKTKVCLNSVQYAFASPLIMGRLVKRYKRFLAEVLLPDGQTIICHCPNSGAMTGCATPGAEVGLSYNADPKRKTAYTWQIVKADKTWVGINTALTNPLVLQAAQKKMPPFFSNALQAKPEIKVSPHSRLDMLVSKETGALYVEVKSVTLVHNKIAMFPDAVTARGQKHLQELVRLKQAGHEALMVYVVQRADALSFAPARHIDPVYAHELAKAVVAGVKVLVWQAKVNPQTICLWRQLEWRLD